MSNRRYLTDHQWLSVSSWKYEDYKWGIQYTAVHGAQTRALSLMVGKYVVRITFGRY